MTLRLLASINTSYDRYYCLREGFRRYIDSATTVESVDRVAHLLIRMLLREESIEKDITSLITIINQFHDTKSRSHCPRQRPGPLLH